MRTRPTMGALVGIPFLLFALAVLKLVMMVGGGVEGVKLCTLLSWLLLLLEKESSESTSEALFFFLGCLDIPLS